MELLQHAHSGPVTYELPQQLEVCGYLGEAAWNLQMVHNEVQPTTYLFRVFSGLGRTLPMAAKAAGRGTINVISAGCSNGAEIDTILGLSRRHMPDRDVAVLGLDQEADILEDASAGAYRLLGSVAELRRQYLDAGLDFDLPLAPYGMRFDNRPNERLALIDTRELRERYDVALEQADMTRSVPADRLAHLIACHHVAYHYGPEDATAIATNLAAQVAVGGILSFGVILARQTPMGPAKEMPYYQWQRQIHAQLRDDGFQRARLPVAGLDAYRRVA